MEIETITRLQMLDFFAQIVIHKQKHFVEKVDISILVIYRRFELRPD